MILYHLEKWKHKDIWPPEGTLHVDGSWNKPGQWIIYTSPVISLAKLEVLANENNLPIRRVCMTIEVTNRADIFEVTTNDLQANSIDKPSPVGLLNFTTQFLKSSKLLMQVPSAQSIREYNYLINVRHPKFQDKVKLLSVTEELFDMRLAKS